VAEDELAVAIERLHEAGAIDDERFARRFAEDKRELRGWGPDRITGALRARGIDEPLIEAAVEAEGAEALLERALELVEVSGIDPCDESSRARALSLLARRGFPLEVAYEAVRALERRSRAA
jgi:regulatory protein